MPLSPSELSNLRLRVGYSHFAQWQAALTALVIDPALELEALADAYPDRLFLAAMVLESLVDFAKEGKVRLEDEGEMDTRGQAAVLLERARALRIEAERSAWGVANAGPVFGQWG
jgi:hypothetical protein